MATRQKTIEFDARLAAAVSIAQARGDVRYFLNGVLFDGPYAVASNAHVMTVAHDPEADNPRAVVRIPPAVRAAMRGRNHARRLMIETKPHAFPSGKMPEHEFWLPAAVVETNARYGPGRAGDPFLLEEIRPYGDKQIEYPNWRAVLEGDAAEPVTPTFGPKVMETVVRTANAVDAVEFTFYSTGKKQGPNLAYRCRYAGFGVEDRLVGIVMPIKGPMAKNELPFPAEASS